MSHQHLKVKSTSGFPEIIKHLSCIIQSLKKRSLFITTSQDSILLRPQEYVSLELEAEVKLEKNDLREKLVLEMKWKKNEEPGHENVEFVIDHSLPQETDDQGDAKEKTGAAPEKDMEVQPIMRTGVSNTTAIHDSLKIPSHEMTAPTRKTTGVKKNRAAVRKSGRG
jgi:amphi-Trp domain-containing protein